ncbi:hypothetical protein TREPR_1906 [Treponema primitia ZAS-2]|uniref:Uncharacterized protein n=1 Tax=Treponema primitia (strain ATCC BAA-887 / DSM 12427 / ZAS-2) TaxID=545694 RepID=F5YL29_TREPZ|nr:hypothetical protein [Treponema primitia]AEF84487.1 hypothetical protein TREPR_1906 [Treponema primitia ZAS-2]
MKNKVKMHNLKKDDYFSLIDDSVKYDTNKDIIEKYLDGDKEDSEPSIHIKTLKEYSIPETEYQQLLKKSHSLAKYEFGFDLLQTSFKSYQELFENEQQKVLKLTDIVTELIEKGDTYETKERVWALITKLLE